jgi:type IV secretory pathway VirB6-like protein
MANVNAAFGLVPVRHMSGNVPRANKYTIASGLAENIFTGDLCIIDANGQVTPHTATEVNNIGVFAGVSYTASDGSYVYSQYWPTGTTATNIIAYIYDDPYTVYKIQSAGTPAQTNIGNCADVVAGSGSTTTGQSGFSLNGTMSNGTATCKIIGLWESPDNSMAQYAILEVLINEHLLKDSAGI